MLEAINDDKNTIAYFTSEDTERKGRVNERLDLCDSYGVDGPTVYNVSFESYDKKTGKALYCMTANGSKKMSGKMNSFKINTLMSNKKIYNYFNTNFDLSIAKTNPQTAPMSDYESYSGNVFDTILLPDTMNIAKKVEISNIGLYIEKYQGNPEDCTVSVKMKDNSVFNISAFTNNESENYSNTEWSLSTALGSFIDINEISSVTMNGKIIYEQ